MHGKSDAMPCLAEMELAKYLIPCCCGNLVDCIITEMLGTYTYDRPGFVGDIIVPCNEKFHFVSEERNSWIDKIDLPNNIVVFGHCYRPINPRGNDRVPYIIRSHVLQKDQNERCKEEYVTLVGLQAKWPIDETVTVAKTDVWNKKMAVFTGKTVDGNLFYEGFYNSLCRTNFCGGYRETFKDLAELVGFKVVEEDRYS